MILVFFLSFHNSKLWFRVGSFSEQSFIFLSYNSKSIIQVLINIIIMSEVLEHMFYSIKMANRSPFRCPKILFGPFRWLKSFSVFSRTGPKRPDRTGIGPKRPGFYKTAADELRVQKKEEEEKYSKLIKREKKNIKVV